jgi:hypothetical protein
MVAAMLLIPRWAGVLAKGITWTVWAHLCVNFAIVLRHPVGAQLGHSCSQTRLFRPEYGLRIRRKLLDPNNKT